MILVEVHAKPRDNYNPRDGIEATWIAPRRYGMELEWSWITSLIAECT